MATGIGAALKRAREERGVSMEDASRSTRVRVEYLRALEQDRFDIFSGDVYAKGCLTSYAKYLQIDPEPLLEEYRSKVQRADYDPRALVTEPIANAPGRSLPRQAIWAGAAVVVLLLALGLSSVMGGRNPEPADPRPVGPVATGPPTPTVSASPTPTATPTPAFDGVRVVLDFREICWMRVTIGDNVFEELVPAGEQRDFESPEQVTIRYGNPGGVDVTFNGQPLGAAAPAGNPATVVYTRDGAVNE